MFGAHAILIIFLLTNSSIPATTSKWVSAITTMNMSPAKPIAGAIRVLPTGDRRLA